MVARRRLLVIRQAPLLRCPFSWTWCEERFWSQFSPALRAISAGRPWRDGVQVCPKADPLASVWEEEAGVMCATLPPTPPSMLAAASHLDELPPVLCARCPARQSHDSLPRLRRKSC